MPPLLAAELHGYLRSGDELGGGSEPANSIMFVLGDEDGEELSTFIVAKDAFRSAGWLDDREQVLELNCGVVQFLISPADD